MKEHGVPVFRLSERERGRERERNLPSSSVLSSEASDCRRLQAERVRERENKRVGERGKKRVEERER